MLQQIILMVHVSVAMFIVILVLLQRGKGADAGTGFGAGASGTVFGSRGTSNFFSRATAVLAVFFFATSLTLAYLATQQRAPDSLLEGSVIEAEPGELAPVIAAPPANAPELPNLEEPPADSADP